MKSQKPIIVKLSKPRNPVAVRLQKHRPSTMKDRRAERGGAGSDWKWNRSDWDWDEEAR